MKVLAGRYEIHDKVGGGGMAVVYRARDKLLNRMVAIKILRPEFSKDASFVDNFRKESRAAASLTHPNIVSIFDVGKEGNMYYIVMELVEGRPLSDIIRDYAPMDFRDTIRIGMQVAAALREAHKNNIIHRDVKPHNILITDDGMAKITDFGIARAATDRTAVGDGDVIMGSVHYFSPEQGRGQFVDEKSDIYSLGIVLYEMLTGHVPFDADTPVAVAVMHMNDPIVPPSKLVSGVPPGLEQIILKATEKYQVNRFRTVGEMYNALANVDYITGRIADPDMERYVKSSITPAVFTKPAEDLSSSELDSDLPVPYGPEDEEYGPSDEYPDEEYDEPYYEDDAGSRRGGHGEDDWDWAGASTAVSVSAGANVLASEEDKDEAGEGAATEAGGKPLSKRKQKKLAQIEKHPSRHPRFKKFKVYAIMAGIVLALALCYPLYQGIMWVASDHAIQVPQFVGLTLEEAQELAEEKGFTLVLDSKEYSDTVEAGLVLSQTPKRGQRLSKGGEVTIVLSKGPKKDQDVTDMVPNLLGKTLESAEYTITQYGYVLGSVTYEDSDRAEGTVIGQTPTGGTKLDKGGVIDLVLSNGSKTYTTTVPRLVGTTESMAMLALQDLGLFGYVMYEYSDTVAEGIVISQDVAAGTDVDQGSWVTIVVSKGQDPGKKDTDGDGLTDAEEAAFGSDPTKPDTDGDGYTDKQEYDAGSDPNDPISTPSMPHPVLMPTTSPVGLTEAAAKAMYAGFIVNVSVDPTAPTSGGAFVPGDGLITSFVSGPTTGQYYEAGTMSITLYRNPDGDGN
jgi:serine/threonine-protein kinase